MATRGGGRSPTRGRGNIRPGRRGTPPLPSLPNAHLKQNHKYTIKEVDVILDACGRYSTNVPAREWLRREFGLDASLDTLQHYREARATEVQQRKATYLAALDGEPLANRRERLVELRLIYAQLVASQLREPCRPCVGTGVVYVEVKKKNGKTGKNDKPEVVTQVCEACAGRKWTLPLAAQATVRELRRDVRLDTLPELPPDAPPKLVEARLAVLQQIREEVGDHWSPRDKGLTGDEGGGRHLHLHGEAATKVAEALTATLAASSEQVVEVYKARHAARLKEGTDV